MRDGDPVVVRAPSVGSAVLSEGRLLRRAQLLSRGDLRNLASRSARNHPRKAPGACLHGGSRALRRIEIQLEFGVGVAKHLPPAEAWHETLTLE